MGGTVRVLGVTQVQLELNDHVCDIEVLVVNSAPEACIIGLDLIAQHPELQLKFNQLKNACQKTPTKTPTKNDTETLLFKATSPPVRMSHIELKQDNHTQTPSWLQRQFKIKKQLFRRIRKEIKKRQFINKHKLKFETIKQRKRRTQRTKRLLFFKKTSKHPTFGPQVLIHQADRVAELALQDPSHWNPVEIGLLERTRELLREMCSDVAAESMSDLKPSTTTQHVIEVTDGPPVREKLRVVPQHKRDEFKKLVQEMIDTGLIVPSKSDWASATRLVQKEDGSLRITIDFRRLNARTIKDAYPLPVISIILALLSQARFYTKLDLMSGYYQIGLDPKSRKYTAFRCELGLFEFTVMPMGLTNATATFQRLMDSIFADVVHHFELHYLDDIFVFSQTLEEHVEHVREVLNRLKKNNLFVKRKKCEFAQTEIEFLGHKISHKSIQKNTKNTDKIRN